MSRSRKDAKGGHVVPPKRDYCWSGRWGGDDLRLNRWIKTQTHRKERRAGKLLHDTLRPRQKGATDA